MWDIWLSPVPAVKSLDEDCNTPTPAMAGEKIIIIKKKSLCVVVPEALASRSAPSETASRHRLLHLPPFGPGGGRGWSLGSGLMPGALVTHLNGEQTSLLATSIHNRIVDPDPLDSESVDSPPHFYLKPSPCSGWICIPLYNIFLIMYLCTWLLHIMFPVFHPLSLHIPIVNYLLFY